MSSDASRWYRSSDSAILGGLLGLLVVLLPWREPLPWWAKATAFTMGDIAFLGMINGFFGSYFSVEWKIGMVLIGLGLIPLVFFVSWRFAGKTKAANVSELKLNVAQVPPTVGQEWIKETINVVQIERWIPNPTRSYTDGTFGVSGILVAQDDMRYEYNIRITKDGKAVVTNQSSVTGVRDS